MFWPARVENPPPACLPDTLNTCKPGPPAERLSIFSDCDVVKARMHIQHKLGLKSKKVSNHQSTKYYTNYQELIKEGIVEKDITQFGKTNSIWKNLWRKLKCHALPHRFDTQPKACRSVQPYRRPTDLPHLPEA
jgi:hypothetical protein